MGEQNRRRARQAKQSAVEARQKDAIGVRNVVRSARLDRCLAGCELVQLPIAQKITALAANDARVSIGAVYFKSVNPIPSGRQDELDTLCVAFWAAQRPTAVGILRFMPLRHLDGQPVRRQSLVRLEQEASTPEGLAQLVQALIQGQARDEP